MEPRSVRTRKDQRLTAECAARAELARQLEDNPAVNKFAAPLGAAIHEDTGSIE